MRALLLEQQHNTTRAKITEVSCKPLPEGHVVVDIFWSSLNYKDALAITGKGKIIRQFPMVPGIDFSGRVHCSRDPHFKTGESVILTGWGVGERYWGGFAEQACVLGDWLLPLPKGLNERQAMIIGTAGLTAMLCVMALEDGGVKPSDGDILVTGASGGVGSVAVALLAALGYCVTAMSGRPSNSPYLKSLGATNVIPRYENDTTPPPLEKQRWAGAIDTVGNTLLARLLSEINYNGTVATCGLAGGHLLPTTVMPFILRNVRLQGIDSVNAPLSRRKTAWQRIATLLPPCFYSLSGQEITLDEVPAAAEALLNNQITGRTVITLRK